MRPRRDPEHDAADDRPSRRAPRAAVRQVARGQDAARRWRTRRACSAVSPAVDGWHQNGAGELRARGLRPDAAAPAITRALVEAGADVLSIGESRHSLEDVYLELIDEDVDRAEAGVSSDPDRAPIFRKELREFRRNGAIIATMAVLPVIFLIEPADPDLLPPGLLGRTRCCTRIRCCYMLGIPALVPGGARRLRRSSANGSRARSSRVLTTPIRREELMLGKALAVLVPALVDLLRGVRARRRGDRAVRRRRRSPRPCCATPQLLAQVLFTPLLAALVDLGRRWRSRRGRPTSASPSSSHRSRACRPVVIAS